MAHRYHSSNALAYSSLCTAKSPSDAVGTSSRVPGWVGKRVPFHRTGNGSPLPSIWRHL